jgi:hypothetical protein
MIYGPNQTIEDRVRDILLDKTIVDAEDDNWRRLRSRAYSDGDLQEGTAITVAEFVAYGGTIEQVDKRVLELMTSPVILKYDSDMQWKEARSRAWTNKDLLTVAALAMIEFIRHFHHIKVIRNRKYAD